MDFREISVRHVLDVRSAAVRTVIDLGSKILPNFLPHSDWHSLKVVRYLLLQII